MLIKVLTLLLFTCNVLAHCPNGLKKIKCVTDYYFTSLTMTDNSATEEIIKEDINVLNGFNFTKTPTLTLKTNAITKLQWKHFLDIPFQQLTLELPKLSAINDCALHGQQKSLIDLNLVSAQLQEIPIKSINKLPSLKGLAFNSIYGIKTVKNGTFQYLSSPENIVFLSISLCGILSIEDGSFTPLINLKTLTLVGNPLTQFSLSSLPRSLKTLTNLDLRWNRIQNLPLDVINNLPSNSNLNLHGNDITTISEKEMKGVLDAVVTRTISLDLTDNDLQCSCSFKLLTKISQSDKVNYLKGTCNNPVHLKGKSLSSLALNDFPSCKS